MTPDLISSLVNLGSAGAVIIVVIIFLKSIKERDAEWRDFFTELNKSNKDDVCKLADTIERIASTLDAHDKQAKEIMTKVVAIDQHTQPVVRVRRQKPQ